MFKKKVGSDACLVLDGVLTDAETGQVTITQTFTYEDLKKALETRVVCVKVAFGAGISVMGLVSLIADADPEETPPTDAYFMVAIVLPSGAQLVQFTESDGSWYGTITLGD